MDIQLVSVHLGVERTQGLWDMAAIQIAMIEGGEGLFLMHICAFKLKIIKIS